MELMNEQEIHEFGLEVLEKYLTGHGYEIEFAQPDKNTLPHMAAKKGDELVFIIAATDVYPNKGKISDRDKTAMLEHAAQFNAKVACAYLGLANADGARSGDKELAGKAYRGANFMVDFSGLEFIYFED